MKRAEMLGQGTQHIAQRGKRELALGLESARPKQAHARAALGRMVEQGALSNAGLTEHDQRPAVATPSTIEQFVDPATRFGSAKKHAPIVQRRDLPDATGFWAS